MSRRQIRQLEENCREFGIQLMGLDSPYQGIVHVVGPELGLTQPGLTIVCGDSHTSTHGAFGLWLLELAPARLSMFSLRNACYSAALRPV